MSLDDLALLTLVLAAVPAALFVLNLFVYRPIVGSALKRKQPVSVLIPARDEERNIVPTLSAVLASRECEFEVIVLDDHSSDHTRELVQELARNDKRLRLASAPSLPAGWCGKQHACHTLSKLARHPLLVFMDADVRLQPDALGRMAAFMEQTGAALASGVPRQELGSFSERLLIPLIHFILLGFLPMHAMRRTRMPSMSAGCGQLFIADRAAYERSGGHAALRNSLHDGLKLPRAFRHAGLRTELFDATDLATCRMYQNNAETWRGLGKNATEGLAAPATIVPVTLLLFVGQVLPFLLLGAGTALSTSGLGYAAAAVICALLPRALAVWRFQQPPGSMLLHPLGVMALLAIQWQALLRQISGKPSEWKGRNYSRSPQFQPGQAS